MADKPTTNIELTWNGGFKFTSNDAHGHSVIVDAPMKDGDTFDGFKPGELLLTSLAGCSGIDIVNILLRQRQKVTGFEVKVTGKQQPDPPWTWDEIELEYIIKGKGLNEGRVERAVRLSEDKYCSIAATIEGRSKVTSTFRIVEDDAE